MPGRGFCGRRSEAAATRRWPPVVQRPVDVPALSKGPLRGVRAAGAGSQDRAARRSKRWSDSSSRCCRVVRALVAHSLTGESGADPFSLQDRTEVRSAGQSRRHPIDISVTGTHSGARAPRRMIGPDERQRPRAARRDNERHAATYPDFMSRTRPRSDPVSRRPRPNASAFGNGASISAPVASSSTS